MCGGASSPPARLRGYPNREQWVERLQAYREQLESELKNVQELIERLGDAPGEPAQPAETRLATCRRAPAPPAGSSGRRTRSRPAASRTRGASSAIELFISSSQASRVGEPRDDLLLEQAVELGGVGLVGAALRSPSRRRGRTPRPTSRRGRRG